MWLIRKRPVAGVVGHALGSILYLLLTGRVPFAGGRPVAVLLQVVHDQPTPPSATDPPETWNGFA